MITPYVHHGDRHSRAHLKGKARDKKKDGYIDRISINKTGKTGHRETRKLHQKWSSRAPNAAC